MLFSCQHCGSENVEGLLWVPLNSPAETDLRQATAATGDTPEEKGWCWDCNDHCLIATGRIPLAHLQRLRTLAKSQADDLKVDTGSRRVWLSRCTIEDGEPFNNKVTVEQLIDGSWQQVDCYEAK